MKIKELIKGKKGIKVKWIRYLVQFYPGFSLDMDLFDFILRLAKLQTRDHDELYKKTTNAYQKGWNEAMQTFRDCMNKECEMMKGKLRKNSMGMFIPKINHLDFNMEKKGD